jgi:YidC/Oxa1 family membrane protein insertase
MGSEQKNALMAVVLSGLILFGWQYWFAPKKATDGPIEPAAVAQSTTQGTPDAPVGPEAVPSAGPIEPAIVQETYTLSKNGVTVEFDNTLSVKNFVNPQAAFQFGATVGSKNPASIDFDFGEGWKRLSFVKRAEAGDSHHFHNATYDVTLLASLDEKGIIHFKLTSPREFKYRFNYNSEHLKLENGQQRFFSYFTDSLNHIEIGDEDNGDRAIKWTGIDFNYHLFGTYFDQELPLVYKSTTDGKFSLYSNTKVKTLEYGTVFVKKEYNYLQSLGHNLKNSVDFGIWGFFAEWILKGLQWFYQYFPNYGVSIILLTLLIRLITFPLQYKSFVSMKKLQLVQPELTKIREKYKEDPQRMQKESMELFKKSGANPIGGCLPLLLQMPVFFAFYKVLYSAVELVNAPFILWLHDLSNKDPYFVLPVLMTGAMFLQQKLTPNTISDPVQKKVMMFMPLVFGFIMKDLPSGLSLYIFVSTIFGILQQLIVFNAKKDTAVVVA